MYFEVYIDELLVLQFVMNLYLLQMVNIMLKQSVPFRRIVLGALLGAILSIAVFFLPFSILICATCSFAISTVCMSVVTFRTRSGKSFFLILEKMCISTLLLGGLMLSIFRIFPEKNYAKAGIWGILAVGGIVCIVIHIRVKQKKRRKNVCKVTLYGNTPVTVEALIDTGNSLTEPISRKPVAVLDKNIFDSIYKTEDFVGIRMVPYHSIGKRKGMLRGYLLRKILVETEENMQEYNDIYVGISDEVVSDNNSYKMIINPKMLE